MKEYKVGDKVVCTLKERPDYFDELGRMDYMLDKKTVLEVKNVRENWVDVYDGWYLNKKHIELYEEQTTLELITLIGKVKEWSIDKKLDVADPHKQFIKLIEEVGELASGLSKSNHELIVDSIGDSMVVLIILCQQLGLTLEHCLEVAYNEIKDRKGKIINGVFVKNGDIKWKNMTELSKKQIERIKERLKKPYNIKQEDENKEREKENG